MIEAKELHAIDVRVGANIRRIRNLRQKSQTDLATAMGLTFQQVQKYEKGTNRVSSSRLFQIADFLKVDTDELLGSKKTAGEPVDDLTILAQSRLGVRLAKAFNKIDDPDVTSSIVRLVENVADLSV